MNKSDFKGFSAVWMNAHAVSSSNSSQSDDVIKYIFELLEMYKLEHVAMAIKKHSAISRFAPTPADIIKLLETKHKHISADEAWGLCPKSELETTVWTGEMAEAYAACFDLLSCGDRIGARMAFKGAYERITNLSELQGNRPAWKVSIGSDKTLTEPAVKNAVALGRISSDQAQKFLPPPQDAGFIGKMLVGKVVNINSKNKAQVARLKQSMADAEKISQEKERTKKEALKKEVLAFEQRRADAIKFCEAG